MVPADIFDTKVVYNQGEGDGSCVVAPEGWSTWSGCVAMLGKVEAEAGVGDAAGLLEAWHAFADLHVDPTVAC